VSRNLRRSLATCALLATAIAAGSCGRRQFGKCGKKLVVIGIDGMDPKLLREYMAQDAMPHFKQLAEEGTFVELGTSDPPQSPVAWSNFITGMDPGGHGVFDFLHRDPKTYAPYSSTVKAATDPPLTFRLPGDKQFEIPPSAQPVRQGRAFWDDLADRGVRASVYKIPAAYPLQKSDQFTLSDMGTPDLHGGIDGIYAYYTSGVPENLDRFDNFGNFHSYLTVLEHQASALLYGPPSPFDRPRPGHPTTRDLSTTRKFTVYRDPRDPVVHIEIEDGDSCTLKEGEWSPWLGCDFVLGPYACHPFDWLHLDNRMHGMVKFYLQQAHPEIKLYCSAVNIDPAAPCMPISTPDDSAVEDVCEKTGRFYTAGLAEETKGLEDGTLSDGEFISQCDDVTGERMKMLDYALANFDDGLLFFYFSTIDLRCHMMWRHIDPDHPSHDKELAAKFAGSIKDAYVTMDKALGVVRERIGKDTPLIVLSDHGFSTFTRRVNLNLWLHEQGWLAVEAPAQAGYDAKLAAEKKGGERAKGEWSLEQGDGLDRTKTKAYAVGFNGLYLNLKDREAGGIVDAAERDRLLEEIRTKLLALRDDEAHGGRPVVLRVDKREDVYHGAQVKNAPDLIVGYAAGYGASDTTALGKLVKSTRARVVEDNKNLWSGNHLMAPEVVPGVFLTNRKIAPKDPQLYDVTATLLSFFGAPVPAEMRGKNLFGN
jgi:predicted AlkP superfamily phosphohydrolase/phosphomutase